MPHHLGKVCGNREGRTQNRMWLYVCMNNHFGFIYTNINIITDIVKTKTNKTSDCILSILIRR